MSTFKRTKRYKREYYDSDILHFKLRYRTVEQFEEKYQAWEGELEKALNYKSHEITFIRLKNDQNGNPVFEAYIEIPEQEEWLRIRFAEGNRDDCFFVIFMAKNHKGPNNNWDSIPGFYETHFIDLRERVNTKEHFYELLDDLQSLSITQFRKAFDVQEEISIWNKYLAALEKVMKEKTVLLKVGNLKKYSQKNRRNRNELDWYFEYDLDTTQYEEALVEPLREAMLPRQVKSLKVTEQEGVIDLEGFEEFEPEFFKKTGEVLGKNYFRWVLPQQRVSHFLDFEFRVSFRNTEMREKEMKALDTDLGAEGYEFQRQGGFYRLENWADFRGLEGKLKKEVFTQPSGPKARLSFSHKLAEPGMLENYLKKIIGLIQGNPSFMEVNKSGVDGIRIISKWLKKYPDPEALSEFSLITVSTRVALVPDEGKPLPKVKGCTLNNNEYTIQATSQPELKRVIEEVKKANPKLEFPSYPLLELEWFYRLNFLANPAKWQKKIKDGIQKLTASKLEWPHAAMNFSNEKENQNTLEKIRAIDPNLIIKPICLETEINFKVLDQGFRKATLRELRTNLHSALGKNLLESTISKDQWEIKAQASFKNREQLEQLKQLLKKMEDSNLFLKMKSPEGLTRLKIEFDNKAYEAFLNEIWKDIRRKKVKFLSDGQRKEYEKEAAGRAGSFRGGEELGNLIGLRGGKAKVLLDDPDTQMNTFRSGYLLPVFIGDLAQLNRLKNAIRTVQYPSKGSPANPNLANFIFDPSMAGKINTEFDVRSDRHWALKYELNEKNLNELQTEAVWKVIEARDMVLIQGPPGTGKTTVIAEIIWQMLQEDPDSRILISSQAHLAVDNALERLYKKNLIRPIRIASSQHAKKSVEPEGLKYFEDIIEDWVKADSGSQKEKVAAANAVNAWMERTAERVDSDNKFAPVLTKWKKKLASPPPDVKGFFKEIYLDNVNIVAATCSECGRSDFKERYGDGFDCVIVDEASKATPPEMLIPLILGRKVVIIGDHKQLPPMIEEKRIEEVLIEMGEEKLANELEEIKTSQFEKLFLGADDSIRVTLTTQYRMHKQIMQVIDAFYKEEGGLQCGIEETMDEEDLSHKGSRWHGLEFHPLLDPDTHVIWVEVNTPEINHKPSYSNDGEVDAIRKILNSLLNADGYEEYQKSWKKKDDREIGLISFYAKQVEKLNEVVDEFRGKIPIRLRTVDKFQGMERNIMIVSTVRSDRQVLEGKVDQTGKTNKSIGFAKDFRRINVAFSRARRLLIIVGNETHFAKNNDLYKEIKKVIGRFGLRLNAAQLMD